MASCRCADMQICQDKINKIEDAKTVFYDSIGGTDWQGDVSQLEENMYSTIYKTTSSSMVNTGISPIKSQHSALSSAQASVLNKIEGKLSTLRSDLSSMSEEDHDYHEAEKQKSEEKEEK